MCIRDRYKASLGARRGRFINSAVSHTFVVPKYKYELSKNVNKAARINQPSTINLARDIWLI